MPSRGTAAQVGIGTMIVFIATILVASVAASVLMDVASKLQRQSSQTGNAATEQVATSLEVVSIVGRRDSTANAGLQDLDLFLRLGAGASQLDLSQMRIQLQNGTLSATLNYSQAAPPPATQYAGTTVRDADGSFSAADPVLTAGDVVNATMDLEANGLEFQPRDEVTLVLFPEVGQRRILGFTTPVTYGTSLVVELG